MITPRYIILILTFVVSVSSATLLGGDVGGVCLNDTGRPCSIPNSECIEGVCLCANFHRFFNGTCIQLDTVSTIGKQCRSGEECRGQGEFCSSFGICMCLSTHVELGMQCKPIVYPEQFGCEDSRQCSKGYPGAECDASRKCVCPHGMHSHLQTCVTPSLLANLILSEDQLQRRYQNNHKYLHGNFNRRRLAPISTTSNGIAPDSICSVDSDCAGHPLSYCDGVCKCIPGSLNAGSTCISGALQSAGSCPPGQTYITELGACMTVQQPGEPCQYSRQCAEAEPGAFCLNLKCACIYGMILSGNGCTFASTECTKRGFIYLEELGECKEVIPPGGRGCSHHLQCSKAYPDAFCHHQICRCPLHTPVAIDGTCGKDCSNGETYSGVTGECLPTVQPGNECYYSSQCHAIYPGMVCDRNRCRCSSGMVFSGSKCTSSCPVGYMVNSRGVCIQGCRSNQVEIDGECLDQSVPGNSCVVNAQCTGGSSCYKSVCVCPKAMIPKGNLCVMVESPPLGPCNNGEICVGGSFCSNGNCTCHLGRQVINEQCVTPLTADIGSVCVRVGVVCGGGSICVNGLCTCPFGTTPSQNQCMGHRTANPGESCPQQEECTGNSYCNEITKHCECTIETQMVIGKTCQERLRSHPGYPCSNGEICVGGSICVRGRCSCSVSQMEHNKQCVEQIQVGPGEICGNGEICGGGSECDYQQKKCICKSGRQNINQQCVEIRVVGPGESCSSALTRCGGRSYCIRGSCECAKNMAPERGICVKRKQVLPGRQCSSTDMCISESVCRNGTCQCEENRIIKAGRCDIRKIVQAGEQCKTGDECVGNSTCNGDICECSAGEIVRGGRCQKRITIRPGYLCNPEDICIGKSTCMKGMCQCKAGYRIVGEVCIKNNQVAPGGKCARSDDCIGGSICNDGTCMCSVGRSLVGEVCIEILKVPAGGSCMKGEICDGGSFCDGTSKICSCVRGEEIKRGKCIKIVRKNLPIQVDPGMSCAEGEQCRGGSECREGMCVCISGLYLRDKICSPPIRGQLLLSSNDTVSPCPTDGSCKLPNCFCSKTGMAIPGGFRPKEIPQMVILSFDDAITDRTINIYKSLFNGKHRNPNGCPIKGTFFISHQWNNYDQTQWVHSKGNEIAVNSITHETLSRSTKERWRHEMVGLRDSLKAFSYIEDASIKGIRAPQLLLGGDAQFEMMKENGFLYDNSMSVKEGPVWPQTLDHQLAWDCGEQNCPRKAHKGLWEIPLQLLQANDGIWHTMAKTTIKPYDTRDSVRQMLRRNFYRNYKSNRAPFILTADTDFLTYLPDNGVVHAIEDWLEEILNKTDVYVVTTVQAIQWMSDPSSLSNIEKFRPWQCNVRLNDFIHPCENPSICSYPSISPSGVAHSFRVCGSCPKAYPWIEDPLGKKQMNRKH